MSPKCSSRPLLLTLSTCLLFASAVLGKCECGYSVKGQSTYTDAFEADFFHQDEIANDLDWDVSRYPQNYHDSTSMQYSLDNVISRPLTRSSVEPGLQLIVRGHTGSGAVGTAELVTRRKDMHYGSYRAAIKSTAVSGTCGSVFWMRNGPQDETTNQEIDFEILSYEDTDASPQRKIHTVLHGRSGQEHDVPQVSFRPSDGYHEYRFDWSPEKVSFFVDGQHKKDFTDRVPTVPGMIILNHWSHGQSGWEQGPPDHDAIMTVAYVKAYFNTTTPSVTCVDPEAKDAYCEVPEQLGPVSPETPTTFLTDREIAAAALDIVATTQDIAAMVANQYLAIVVQAPRVNLQGAVMSGIIESDP
ncbi:MAG: hypothetical protein L6R36_008313 [Xanthoria steineri]|nr:MAG: hypothetical protein L6R36_008313 [Xanthoria steineri]